MRYGLNSLLQAIPHESFLDGTVILALTNEVRLINEAHVGEMNFHDTSMRPTDVHNLNVCKNPPSFHFGLGSVCAQDIL